MSTSKSGSMSSANAKIFRGNSAATMQDQDIQVLTQIFKNKSTQERNLLLEKAGLLNAAAVAKKPLASMKPVGKSARSETPVPGTRRSLKRPRVDNDSADDEVADLRHYFKKAKVDTGKATVIDLTIDPIPTSPASSQSGTSGWEAEISSPPSSPQSPLPLPRKRVLGNGTITSLVNTKASSSAAPSSSTSSDISETFIKKEGFSPSGLMKSVFATSSPTVYSSVASKDRATQDRPNTPRHTGDWEEICGSMKSLKGKIKTGNFVGEDFEATMWDIHRNNRDYIYFLNDNDRLQKDHTNCDLDVVDALANREVIEPLGDGKDRLFPPKHFFFCFGLHKKKTLIQVPRSYIREQVKSHQKNPAKRAWFLEAARIFLANTGLDSRSRSVNRSRTLSGKNSTSSKNLHGYFPKVPSRVEPKKPTLIDADATKLEEATNIAYVDLLLKHQEEEWDAEWEAEKQVAAEMSNTAIEKKGKGKTAEDEEMDMVCKDQTSVSIDDEDVTVYDDTDTETIAQAEKNDAVRDEPKL